MSEKIVYNDKIALQNDENIPNENKVTAIDLNEIKRVVNFNAVELEEKQDKITGKSLSENDFTNEYKKKLDNLQNYNDTQLKERISNIENKDKQQDTEIDKIKQEQTKQNSNIESNKTKISALETDNTKNKTEIEELKLKNNKLQEENNHLINQIPTREI